MLNKQFNKRAEAKLLSIWWFLVLIIIAVGIVAGTLIFFSANVDVRAEEANIIGNRIIDCLAPNGILVNFNNFDFYSDCHFKKSVLESGNYMIRLETFDSTGNEISNPINTLGNAAFIEDCKIGNVATAIKYPRCIEKTVFVLNQKDEEIKLKILVGDNYGQRASTK